MEPPSALIELCEQMSCVELQEKPEPNAPADTEDDMHADDDTAEQAQPEANAPGPVVDGADLADPENGTGTARESQRATRKSSRQRGTATAMRDLTNQQEQEASDVSEAADQRPTKRATAKPKRKGATASKQQSKRARKSKQAKPTAGVSGGEICEQ